MRASLPGLGSAARFLWVYFKDRVNLFVALAPAVRLDQSTLANILTVLSAFEGILEPQLAKVGIHELFGKGWEVEF